MDRDEDVTVELPVVEASPPPARVYVPPKTIPPKTNVATFELDTVQVRPESETDPRHAPTIRVRRSQSPAPLSQEVPTDRPGQVWSRRMQAQGTEPLEDPARQEPVAVDFVPPGSEDAVTLRLSQSSSAAVGGSADGAADARGAVTRPANQDHRDAATLSANRIRLLGQPGMALPAIDAPVTATPRPASRVTAEELEAIQSARTLEVQQTPFPPTPESGGHRRVWAVLSIATGVVLGILIVWAFTLTGRSARLQSAAVGATSSSALAPTRPPRISAAGPHREVVAPEPPMSVTVPNIVPVPLDSASRAPDLPAEPSTGPARKSEPTPSAILPKSRAIY